MGAFSPDVAKWRSDAKSGFNRVSRKFRQLAKSSDTSNDSGDSAATTSSATKQRKTAAFAPTPVQSAIWTATNVQLQSLNHIGSLRQPNSNKVVNTPEGIEELQSQLRSYQNQASITSAASMTHARRGSLDNSFIHMVSRLKVDATAAAQIAAAANSPGGGFGPGTPITPKSSCGTLLEPFGATNGARTPGAPPNNSQVQQFSRQPSLASSRMLRLDSNGATADGSPTSRTAPKELPQRNSDVSDHELLRGLRKYSVRQWQKMSDYGTSCMNDTRTRRSVLKIVAVLLGLLILFGGLLAVFLQYHENAGGAPGRGGTGSSTTSKPESIIPPEQFYDLHDRAVGSRSARLPRGYFNAVQATSSMEKVLPGREKL